jgi:hypothetical protein
MDEINALKREIEALRMEFYRGNFSSRQDFTKYSDFQTALKVPHFGSLPSTCNVGEIGEYDGKLYICSATNTWSIAGTQS